MNNLYVYKRNAKLYIGLVEGVPTVTEEWNYYEDGKNDEYLEEVVNAEIITVIDRETVEGKKFIVMDDWNTVELNKENMADLHDYYIRINDVEEPTTEDYKEWLECH